MQLKNVREGMGEAALFEMPIVLQRRLINGRKLAI